MKEKRKKGRRSKYQSIFCQQMIDFFNQPTYDEIKIQHYKDGKKSWVDIKRMPKELPTLINFAKKIKVGIRTIYDWVDEKHSSYQKDFSHTFTYICKDLQKNFLMQNGLMGLYNPLFAKFVMVNISDWRDRTELSGKIEVEHTTIERLENARNRVLNEIQTVTQEINSN